MVLNIPESVSLPHSAMPSSSARYFPFPSVSTPIAQRNICYTNNSSAEQTGFRMSHSLPVQRKSHCLVSISGLIIFL